MTSATITGFVPDTPTSYARPVQDEIATAGLCGAEMPNGKGCLVWTLSGGVRFAVVDSPADFIVDDVVPLANMGTVVASGSGVTASSVFCLDGDLFVIVNARASSRGTVKLYKANSPTAPTSWSLFTTIQDVDSAGSYFSEPRTAGIPLQLDSGRWVLVQPVWENSVVVVDQIVSAWTSDDSGATWAQRLTYTHSSTGLNYTTGQAGQTAHDPDNGYLYMWSGSDTGGVTYGTALWRSTDSGVGWSITNAPGTAWLNPHPTAFVDDGTTLYLIDVSGSNTTIYSVDGSYTVLADLDDTGEDWGAPGATIVSHTTKAIVTSLGLYFFTGDQVMFTPIGQPAWHFNVHWST